MVTQSSFVETLADMSEILNVELICFSLYRTKAVHERGALFVEAQQQNIRAPERCLRAFSLQRLAAASFEHIDIRQ